MSKHTLHNNVVFKRALTPVAIGACATGKTTAAIDRQGYDGIEFIITYGILVSTTAVVVPVVLECDTTTGSFTSVADGDLVGTEADAGLPAATRTSGTGMHLVKSVGYRGVKRYAKLHLVNTGNTTEIVGVVAALYNPEVMPTS